jgi:predicted nuclease of predicted toxin-antitoxin system
VRWLADECVAARLVDLMRRDGSDVLYIAETGTGATDDAVVRRAVQENRLLLTEDKDFGELVILRRLRVPGLVLLRAGRMDSPTQLARIQAVIDRYGGELFGRFTVVEATRFRSRPLPDAHA